MTRDHSILRTDWQSNACLLTQIRIGSSGGGRGTLCRVSPRDQRHAWLFLHIDSRGLIKGRTPAWLLLSRTVPSCFETRSGQYNVTTRWAPKVLRFVMWRRSSPWCSLVIRIYLMLRALILSVVSAKWTACIARPSTRVLLVSWGAVAEAAAYSATDGSVDCGGGGSP